MSFGPSAVILGSRNELDLRKRFSQGFVNAGIDFLCAVDRNLPPDLTHRLLLAAKDYH